MNNQISTVDFHGQSLSVIPQNNQLLVAIKPICENMGITWGSQYNRIKRNEVLNSVIFMMKTTAEDGKSYENICLPLNYLNGWLFGIETNRIKDEAVRLRVLEYQRECYQVLFNYWQKGSAVRERKPQQLQFNNGYEHLGLSGKRSAEDARKLLTEIRRHLPAEVVPLANELETTITTIWTNADEALHRIGTAHRMIDRIRG